MSSPVVFFPADSLTKETVLSELARFLEVLNKHAKAWIILDLSQVLNCDSAGLALLIEVKRLCGLKQNKIRMQNMSNTMLDLATFFGVDNLFLESE